MTSFETSTSFSFYDEKKKEKVLLFFVKTLGTTSRLPPIYHLGAHSSSIMFYFSHIPV